MKIVEFEIFFCLFQGQYIFGDVEVLMSGSLARATARSPVILMGSFFVGNQNGVRTIIKS